MISNCNEPPASPDFRHCEGTGLGLTHTLPLYVLSFRQCNLIDMSFYTGILCSGSVGSMILPSWMQYSTQAGVTRRFSKLCTPNVRNCRIRS